MKHQFQKGNSFGPKDRAKNLGTFAQKGHTPWNKGLTKDDPRVALNNERRMATLKGNFPRHWAGKKRPEITGENHYLWGKKRDRKVVEKIVLAKRGKYRGEDSPHWKGGMGTERHKLMMQWEYVVWRTAVFVRDDYTCQICNERGGKLQADHIKPWALYPELRYAIDNGRTLCISCHRQTETWGNSKIYRLERN